MDVTCHVDLGNQGKLVGPVHFYIIPYRLTLVTATVTLMESWIGICILLSDPNIESYLITNYIPIVSLFFLVARLCILSCFLAKHAAPTSRRSQYPPRTA